MLHVVVVNILNIPDVSMNTAVTNITLLSHVIFQVLSLIQSPSSIPANCSDKGYE